MRLGPISVILIMVTSIYVLPLVVAKFTGSHTAEVNATEGVDALDCVACHGNILSELNATTESQRVYQVHSDAAGNTSYTSAFLNENITNSSDSKVCMLCHLAQSRMEGSHTQLVIRVCTDQDCHGNNETTNNTGYPLAGNISAKLGSQKNAHERWFDAMSNINSTRRNETGAYYSNDFLTCVGCHTGTSVNINATEALYPHGDVDDPQRRYY